ncbi:sialate O-acetylesterase [Flavobacteriaceae bacterium F08102]|nr:sialate O-acetylesterase [Flavobacteriaceae bacterium F08102]
MKKIVKHVFFMIGIGVIFIGGMISQKYYGLGNIIKMLNVSYVPETEKNYISESHKENLSIFILAGQSNMEGAGKIEDFDTDLNREGIYVFDDDFRWVIGREPVRNKVGPSISFAATLIENNAAYPIGIINVARGGTNIQQWLNNGDDTSLYKGMIKRALAGSSQGEIKGVLFFQGENDAEGDSTDYVDNWHLKFEEFVSEVRQDLKKDSLPIIFAQIGKGNSANWIKVKESQERVNIPYVHMIKTDDIDYQEGSIHFTTDGYVEIGKRFARAYIENFKTTSSNLQNGNNH